MHHTNKSLTRAVSLLDSLIVEAPYMGTIAAAAPVRDFTGQVVAALGHPLSHNKGHAARIATVRRTADKISALLGYEPSK